MATNNAINSSNPIQVGRGGSALSSMTAYAVLCGGTGSTTALQQVSGVGSNLQVLTSNGASSLPSWQSGAGIGTINGTTGSVTGTSATITATDGSATFTCSGTTMTLNFNNSGTGSTAVGANAGHVGTSTKNNGCYFGNGAGAAETTTGVGSCFFGANAGHACTTGNSNVLFGYQAGLLLTSGATNVAVGYNSLPALLTGQNNVCIGANAGLAYTGSETGNILLGTNGVVGESNVTRIGFVNGTASTTTSCFIDGIQSATVTGSAVLVSATGQLGLAVSSRKYKENIEDIGDASEGIYKLRPVVFNYKESKDIRYGLIAEEVAEVYPNLIAYNHKGEINSVMYHELPALLLNEFKNMHKELEDLEARLKSVEQRGNNGNK